VTEPRVVNRYRGPVPQDAINIMRGTPFGNPFKMGRDGTRDEVCDKYEAWIMADEQADLLAYARRKLKGRVLMCCCAPARCHGDTLLRLANEDL